MYEIQKGVPIPPINRGGQRRRYKYPYEDMEVGAMFFAPGKASDVVSTHTSKVGKDLNRSFTVRSCHMRRDENDEWQLCDESDEGAVKGVGVWRTD